MSSRPSRTPGNDLSADQQRAIIEAVDRIPWGDFEYTILDVEELLLRLFAALTGLSARWEALNLAWDEFSVPEEAVAAMSAEHRLAYVGQLVHSLVLRYGLGHGTAADTLVADPWSPADLLRELNDIICLPVMDGS